MDSNSSLNLDPDLCASVDEFSKALVHTNNLNPNNNDIDLSILMQDSRDDSFTVSEEHSSCLKKDLALWATTEKNSA